MYEIRDLPSSLWSVETESLLRERDEQFLGEGGRRRQITQCELFERYGVVVRQTMDFLAKKPTAVLVDITSLPKRFFFPIVKTVLQSRRVRNIIVTYTRPRSYADERLAADPEPWRHLPLFLPPAPEPKVKMAVVGLGWDPLGLPQFLSGEDSQSVSVRILMPFPALPPGHRRNWDFVRRLEPSLGSPHLDPIRVNAYDVSETFQRLVSLSDHGRKYTILAPYGPKPMSLAMCIFATVFANSSVYYTQPKSYNPHYSNGVLTIDGTPQTYAYVLRLNGRNLYRASPD